MLQPTMVEQAKRTPADEVLTEALHRLFETYGSDLTEYFRRAAAVSAERPNDLPAITDERFSKRR